MSQGKCTAKTGQHLEWTAARDCPYHGPLMRAAGGMPPLPALRGGLSSVPADQKGKIALAGSTSDPDMLDVLAGDIDSKVRSKVGANSLTREDTLWALVNDPSEDVPRAVAGNVAAGGEMVVEAVEAAKSKSAYGSDSALLEAIARDCEPPVELEEYLEGVSQGRKFRVATAKAISESPRATRPMLMTALRYLSNNGSDTLNSRDRSAAIEAIASHQNSDTEELLDFMATLNASEKTALHYGTKTSSPRETALSVMLESVDASARQLSELHDRLPEAWATDRELVVKTIADTEDFAEDPRSRELVEQAVKSADINNRILVRVAANETAPPELLQSVFDKTNPHRVAQNSYFSHGQTVPGSVGNSLAKNPRTPHAALRDLAMADEYHHPLAGNHGAPDYVLDEVFDRTRSHDVRAALAGNPRISERVLSKLFKSKNVAVQENLVTNPIVSDEFVGVTTREATDDMLAGIARESARKRIPARLGLNPKSAEAIENLLGQEWWTMTPDSPEVFNAKVIYGNIED